ncbi:MAG: hypothetical protein NC909_00180 [Candidatus Omnitrophica bacterium]|nr:hypothetical protein [Candidatus Omnitrophota bacterium]
MKILNYKRAQTLTEYAILLGIIATAIIAMQVYVKRGLQGRVKDGTDYLGQQTMAIGSTGQYEPYYIEQDFTTGRSSQQTETLETGGGVRRDVTADITNRSGYQKYQYKQTTIP